MRKQGQSDRRLRTRVLIQAGGLLQKSGLMDAFLIELGADLQDYENLQKAARLLGFLRTCLQKTSFNEANLKSWQLLGERILKYE